MVQEGPRGETGKAGVMEAWARMVAMRVKRQMTADLPWRLNWGWGWDVKEARRTIHFLIDMGRHGG